MKNRELIKHLLNQPMDAEVFIGKGMGPVGIPEQKYIDKTYIILTPEKKLWQREFW